MYISKSKNKYGNYYISISKSIRDPETKKTKKIMVKSYGTHDINTKDGKKAIAKAEIDLKEMLLLEEEAKGFKSFEDFILSMSKSNICLHHKNIGYLPYLSIFKELKLPSFFKRQTKDAKLDYDFSDMMFYQVLG
jgi:hypothetical protein